MLTTLTAGLNQRSTVGTYGLNPQRFSTFIVAGLAEVKVFTLADGHVVMFVPEGMAFNPDVSTYHEDDLGVENPQTTPTGLDPQADPAILRPVDTPMQALSDDGAGPDTPQTPNTGLDPQADPTQLFQPDDKRRR